MKNNKIVHSALALTLSLGIIFSGTPAFAASQKTTADPHNGTQMSTPSSTQHKNKSTISSHRVIKHKALNKVKKPHAVAHVKNPISSSATGVKSKGSTPVTDIFKGEGVKTKNEKTPARDAASAVEDTNATGATALCTDGLYSHSATHTGSCSGHGGVKTFLK